MTSISRRFLFLALGLLAIVSLIALVPLGLAASALGVTARNSQGTILAGALRQAALGKAEIGDVNVHLQPSQLFLGRMAFSLFRGDSPTAPGVSGSISRGLGGARVDGLSASLDGGLFDNRFKGSELRLEGLSVRFDNGRCISASGIVRLNLDRSEAGAAMKGQMTGNAVCRNGDLVLPLLSQSTMERLQMQIKGDGSFTATLTVSDPSAEVATALAAGGFQSVAGGYRLVRSGRLY